MTSPSTFAPSGLTAIDFTTTKKIEVGPGAYRYDLPATHGLRAWVVEIAPGAQWPHVDNHDTGELVFVLDGEVIEGEHRYGKGTYLFFEPGSKHRPRSEQGVRLFGINPV